MPTQIVNAQLLVDRAQEIITLMDDYGSVSLVQISVAQGAQRAAIIAAAKASRDANQAALESYAAANGHDLSAQKTATQTKRKTLQKQNNITSP